MPNLGLGLNINYGVSLKSFNTTYQAILANATTRGVIKPSAAEQNLQNALVQSLIDAGIWAKLDAFYMFANNITDATGGFALINWKNPSSNYGTAAPNLPSISPKSGFTGSAVAGSNQGINLNLAANAGANFTSPNGSYGVLVGTISATSNSRLMGASGNSPVINRIRKGTCSIANTGTSTGTITIASGVSDSLFHLNLNSTEGRMYVNGSAGTSSAAVTFVADSQNWHILRYGDDATGFGNSQIKMAFVGGNLAAEANQFYTRVNTYITALNALI